MSHYQFIYSVLPYVSSPADLLVLKCVDQQHLRFIEDYTRRILIHFDQLIHRHSEKTFYIKRRQALKSNPNAHMDLYDIH